MQMSVGEDALEPRVLRKNFSGRPHARVLLEALRQEGPERLGRALGDRRRAAFDNTVHD